jgi:hypothetical protein
LIGCTTSGEIGPNGMQNNGIIGISFTSDTLSASTQLIDNLQHLSTTSCINQCESLVNTLENHLADFDLDQSFFLTLIDGVSKKEEHLLAAIGEAAINIPLIGGSAADNGLFKQTHVYFEGKFHTDCALLTLIHSAVPFSIIKENAYEDTGKQLIITKTCKDQRTIEEFNGDTAADTYAELIGKNVDELNFSVTSNNPVAIKVDDELYIRTIIMTEEDKNIVELPFSCNIEEGMVLRLAAPTHIISGLEGALKNTESKIGNISAILGFDCLCRNLIYKQQGIFDDVSEVMKKNNVFGFHTYGEQFFNSHVNQTFTGVAFGENAQ